MIIAMLVKAIIAILVNYKPTASLLSSSAQNSSTGGLLLQILLRTHWQIVSLLVLLRTQHSWAVPVERVTSTAITRLCGVLRRTSSNHTVCQSVLRRT